MNTIDISSKSDTSKLSNFEPYAFELDGVQVASMEGFLQSLKFKNFNLQISVCQLVGKSAKWYGRKQNWRDSQILWWRWLPYGRESIAYANLLTRVYLHLARQNRDFRNSLAVTGSLVLTHSIGKSDPKETVITENEFCNILYKLRNDIMNASL